MLNPQLQRARDSFAAQFTEEDGQLVFRKNTRGPAIPLRDSERDDLVRQFVRRMSWMTYGGVVAVVLVLGLLIGVPIMNGIELPQVATLAAACLSAIPVMVAVFWAWNEPSRRLEDRAQVSEALTRDQARRRSLDRLTWGQLLTVLGVMAVMALRMKWDRSLLSGSNLFYLIMGGCLFVLLAVQAFRKVRRDRERTAHDALVR